jgi:hypothetical protein
MIRVTPGEVRLFSLDGSIGSYDQPGFQGKLAGLGPALASVVKRPRSSVLVFMDPWMTVQELVDVIDQIRPTATFVSLVLPVAAHSGDQLA